MDGRVLSDLVKRLGAVFVVGHVLGLTIEGRPTLSLLFTGAIAYGLWTFRQVPLGSVPPPRLVVSLVAAVGVIVVGLAAWVPAVSALGRAGLAVAALFLELVGLLGWATDLGRWCEALGWSPAADFRRARSLLAATLAVSAVALVAGAVAGLHLVASGDDGGINGTGTTVGGPTWMLVLFVPAGILWLLGLLRLRRAQKGLRLGLRKGADLHPALAPPAGPTLGAT